MICRVHDINNRLHAAAVALPHAPEARLHPHTACVLATEAEHSQVVVHRLHLQPHTVQRADGSGPLSEQLRGDKYSALRVCLITPPCRKSCAKGHTKLIDAPVHRGPRA